MTAVHDWDIASPRHTDAELVRAVIEGDRKAFAQMYDRYADRLYDFCVGMLRDRDGAADCVQDAFCVAATHLGQLREPDKLRPWLYSIARNEVQRRFRERRRETPSEELPDETSEDPGPDALAARTELADLIAEAAGGLSDRDQTVLELAYRHGLDGPELAEALGVSQTNANTMVGRLRDTVERSLGALLVARRVQGNPARCVDLAAILDGWDGHFNVLMRKRIARHIESCPKCNDERHRLVSPTALLGAAPAFIPAPARLRQQTLDEIQLPVITTDGGSEATSTGRGRKGLFAATLLFAVVGASGGLAYLALHGQSVQIAPAEITKTLPVPSPPPTATKTPSVQPGPGAPSTTPSASAPTPTTTTLEVPTPPSVPPVDTRPPQVFEPVPEEDPVDPPAGDPFAPESGSDPTRNRNGSDPEPDPTTDRPIPNGITGGPQNPGSQPPRRATNNSSLPGDNNSGDGGRGSSSPRRGIPGS